MSNLKLVINNSNKEQNQRYFFEKKELKIILAGMVAPTTHGTKYKKNFDAIYPKLSKKYNLPLIPFLLEGVALDPNLNQQDGIHPNKAGTIVISNTIQDIISKNY